MTPFHYRVAAAPGDHVRASLAMHLVALSTGLTVEDMARDGRLPPRVRQARWLSMYLSHIGYGWPLERVAHAFGVNRATVGSRCRWAEEARADPGIDRRLDQWERAIRGLCDAPRLELGA